MEPKISVIIPVYNEEHLLERALGSVPKEQDVQLILLDDGSTDKTWQVCTKWWGDNSKFFNGDSIIHRWEQNKGVAATMNLGFSLSTGEYIVSLSSDDYYVTDFTYFKPHLDGKNDLIYFDLVVNDGSIWHLDEHSKNEFVGAVKFIRREFLGDTRVPTRKYKEDLPFSQALQAKNPREVFTGLILKRYNWPHEGSLSWQAAQDYENDRELWTKNVGIKTEQK